MFTKSAAADTLQGRAIQAINAKWGTPDVLHRNGRESIDRPVCKKKFAPFLFSVVTTSSNDGGDNNDDGGGGGERQVQVERRFGCKCHHDARKAVIEQHGERDGWELFGQWSLEKAKEEARVATMRMNKKEKTIGSPQDDSIDGETTTTADDSLDDDDEESLTSGSFCLLSSASCPIKSTPSAKKAPKSSGGGSGSVSRKKPSSSLFML